MGDVAEADDGVSRRRRGVSSSGAGAGSSPRRSGTAAPSPAAPRGPTDAGPTRSRSSPARWRRSGRRHRPFSPAQSLEVVSLVFYAGHGIEMDGVNYLVVPVDAHLERDVDVRFETVPQGGLALTAARPASPNRCHRRGVPSPPPATCGASRGLVTGHEPRCSITGCRSRKTHHAC